MKNMKEIYNEFKEQIRNQIGLPDSLEEAYEQFDLITQYLRSLNFTLNEQECKKTMEYLKTYYEPQEK